MRKLLIICKLIEVIWHESNICKGHVLLVIYVRLMAGNNFVNKLHICSKIFNILQFVQFSFARTVYRLRIFVEKNISSLISTVGCQINHAASSIFILFYFIKVRCAPVFLSRLCRILVVILNAINRK